VTILTLILAYFLSPWQSTIVGPVKNVGPSTVPAASGGGGGIAVVGTPVCSLVSTVSGIYTVPSFTATSGAALHITIGSSSNDTAGTYFTSITSKAGGVSTGNTFTQINFKAQTFQTTYGYDSFGITSGSYVITLASTLASSSIGVCVTQITGVTSLIANCTGNSVTATAACGSSITPTASPAIGLGGVSSYYIAESPFSATTPFTLGATNAAGTNGFPGAFANSYYICTASCTSTALTPTFTASTSTYYNGITGAIYQ
jgi:hypothetical protein